MTSSTLNLASLTSTQGFKITGANSGDFSGYSVSTGGDINGDGYDDIVIGADWANSGAGISYVIFGKAAGFNNIALSNLNNSQGFSIIGPSDFSGFVVDNKGDVNGDGYSDILIAKASTSLSDAICYIIFGKAGGFTNIILSSMTNIQGFSITGLSTDPGWPSRYASWAGDVNGDGYSDIVVGTSTANSNTGAAYIIFGKAEGSSNIALSTLTPSIGIKITGANSGDYAGWSVASAGDVNKDGYDDVLIGAPNANSNAGKSYVIFGHASMTNINLASMTKTQGFLNNGCSSNDKLGYAASSIGDINSDGYGDIGISAPGSFSTGGSVEVWFGSANMGYVNLCAQPTSQEFDLIASGSNANGGRSISGAGDVNGDGFADIIIGAPGKLSNTGISYIVFGKASGFSSISLDSMSASQGFSITGENANDYSGWSVSGNGDINGDGYSDIVIGARGANANAGATYVIFGSASGFVTLSPTKMPTQTPTIAPTITLQSGLVAYYPFNGNANDATGNGNNAITNTATLTTDRYGNSNSAYSFDGATSYIEMPGAQFNFVNNMSVSFWVNPDPTQNIYSTILSKSHFQSTPFAFTGEWYVIQSGSTTNYYFYDYITSSASPAVTEAGQVQLLNGVWSHVSIIKEDTTIKYFVNNLLVNTQNSSVAAIASNANLPLLVGASNSGYTTPASQLINLFKGVIDDIKIYNRALTANEVQQLFMDGTQTSTLQNGLVAYYPFSGNANDMSGNGNNGDFNSATLVSDRFGNSNSAYSFDGINSIIRVYNGTRFDFTNNMSISFWVKPSASQTNTATIIEKSHDYGPSEWSIELIENNQNLYRFLYLQSDTNTWSNLASGVNFIANQWNHYVVVKHDTAARSYLNGNLITTTYASSGIKTNGDLPLGIGASYGNGKWFNGTIDDIFLYNRALSATEVVELYTLVPNLFTWTPTVAPTYSLSPSLSPTALPTIKPTKVPTAHPTHSPSKIHLMATTIDLDNLSSSQGFVINGVTAGDQAGYSVSGAGDVNGDGVDDIIIGVPALGNSGYGAVYVIYGKSSNFNNINLASITNSQGFYISGVGPNIQFGFAVSNAGDINKDGYDDLVIGMPGANGNTGISYIIFGSQSSSNINLASISSPSGVLSSNIGISISGASNGDKSGWSVSGAGDVNGDGFEDIIIGAPYAYSNSGRTHILYGNSSLTNINLASITSSKVAVLSIGGTEYLGHTVNGGDINGDGYSDLIIGLYNGAGTSGSTDIVFGKNGFTDINLNSASSPDQQLLIYGANSGDNSGYSVSNAGDVNGDGYNDVIIGAPSASSNTGATYVVFGKSSYSSNIGLNSLTSSQGFSITVTGSSVKLGYSVASAGDMNNDGYDDIVIGAPYTSPYGRNSAGAVYIIFGRSTSETTNINLPNIDPSKGFVVHGAASNDLLGISISCAGDINHDGYDDVLIGANGRNSAAGAAYVIYGNAFHTTPAPTVTPTLTPTAIPTQLPTPSPTVIPTKSPTASPTYGPAPNLNLASLTSTQGFKITGANGGDFSGYSVSTGGDINGDGYSDIIIGTANASGIIYLIFGCSGGINNINLPTLTIAQGFSIYGASNYAGYSVDINGDVNGDGYSDILISRFSSSTTDVLCYVIFGHSGIFSNIDLANLTLTQGFFITGLNPGVSNAGKTVSWAGDVNKDGYDDIVIGTPAINSNAGGAYIVFGKANGFANFALTDLTPSTGIKISGANAGNIAGSFVAAAGDVNKDGYDDVLIGAPGYGTGNGLVANHGIAYLILGKKDGFTNVNLASITADQGFTLSNSFNHAYHMGYSVAGVSDFNQDGYDDVLVGSPTAIIDARANLGAATIFYGSASTANFDAQNPGSRKYKANLGASAGAQTGSSVAAAGDINGDGYPDAIITAPYASSNKGVSYIIFGGNSTSGNDFSSFNIAQGFSITGENANDYSGWSVSGGGDINGDGYDDIVIGAKNANSNAGATYVIFGSASGLVTQSPTKSPTPSPTLAPTTTLQSGLIAYFPFNGNANDATGNGNNGIVHNATLVADRFGNPNSAYSFDGNSSYIIVNNGSQFNFINNMSVSIWIKLPVNQIIYESIISKSHSYITGWTIQTTGTNDVFALFYRQTNIWNLEAGAWDGTTFIQLAVNQWNHLVITKQNTATSYYLNGNLVTTHTATSAVIKDSSSLPLCIGAANTESSPIRYFEGTLDDIRIYKSALTSAEVQQLYMDGDQTSTLQTGLVAYYPFNSNANDMSGNGNNGAVNSATLVTDRFGNSNSAYKFDGSSSYIEIPGSQFNFINQMSISLWINPASSQIANTGLIDKSHNCNNGGAYVIEQTATNNQYYFADFYVSGQVYIAPNYVQLIANSWNHMVVTKQDTIIFYYLNNILIGGGTAPTSTFHTTGNLSLLIGAEVLGCTVPATNIAKYFNGTIDDIFIYNRALSAAEVAELYTLVPNLFTWTPTASPTYSLAPTPSPTTLPTIKPTKAPTVKPTHSPSKTHLMGSNIDLANLSPSQGFAINGASSGDKAGFSVSEAGDVNGDGYDDIIIGSVFAWPNNKIDAGRVYVIFGGANLASMGLSAFTTTSGFRIDGATAYDRTGYSVSLAGDVNKDGYDDVIIGAPGDTDVNAAKTGMSYIIFGKNSSANIDLAALTMSQGISISGASAGSKAGCSVAEAGDVNGDGFNDVIIGAPYGSNAYSYVIYGNNSLSDIDLANIPSNKGFSIYSGGSNNFGYAVSGGDINGDGYSDLIIGATVFYNNAGATFTIFGKANFASTTSLGAIPDPTEMFLFTSGNPGDYSGYSVSDAGDVNGDGFNDIIIGAFGANSNTGIAHVIYGKSSYSSGINLGINTLTASQGFSISGANAGDRCGYSVSSAGDVNNDGYADVIIGATGANSYAGATYVIFGRSNPVNINLANLDPSQGFAVYGSVANAYTGISVSRAGDINKDGYDDVIIGATGANSNTGAAYVIYGNAFSTTPAPTVTPTALPTTSTPTVLPTTAAPTTSLEKGLVAYYSFNGNANDATGHGNDGVVHGATLVADRFGVPNSAYNFDGISSYIKINDGTQFDFENSFSVSIWINPAASQNNWATLFSKSTFDGSSWGIEQNNNIANSYMFFYRRQLTPLSWILSDNVQLLNTQWQNYIITKQDTELKSYINGVLISTSHGSSALIKTNGNSSLFIGEIGGNDLYFKGILDDIRIYNRAITAAEIQQLYTYGAPTVVPTPVPTLTPTPRPTKPTSVVMNTDLSLLQPYQGFVINGANMGERSGSLVSIAGDINGDGYGDIIIGAPNANSSTGTVYVLFGNIVGNNNFNLANLTVDKGFYIKGESTGDNCGFSAANAGDVNGDGFDDIIIGAYNFASVTGRSYLIFGKASGFTNINLSNLTLEQGFSITGPDTSYRSGYAVSSAGDINNDGFDDIIIGAYFADSLTGKSYIIFGKQSGFTNLILSNFSLSDGFYITGESTSYQAGRAVSSAGDFNGDGFSDILIGANAALSGVGRSYLIFGKASGFNNILLSNLNASDGFIITGGTSYYSGRAVASLGDINGDGLDDIIIGAPLYPTSNPGLSCIIYGKRLNFINLNLINLKETEGFCLHGNNGYGYSVSSAGDINGDGYNDIITGSTYSTSYLMFGGKNLTSDIYLANLSITQGFIINGIQLAGASVSGGEDINGDGYADYLIGAPGVNSNAGAVYVLYGNQYQTHFPTGQPTSLPSNEPTSQPTNHPSMHSVALTNINLANGLQLTQGTKFTGSSSNYAGDTVASIGDVNGDGQEDIAIAGRGIVWVVYGASIKFNSNIDLANLEANQGYNITGPVSSFGAAVAAISDTNGDDIDDFVIGAYGIGYGKAYIIYGGNSASLDLSITMPVGKGYIIDGPAAGSNFGQPISNIGDINGDGKIDFAINANAVNSKGAVYIFFGGNTDYINLATGMPVGKGYIITGPGGGSMFGTAIIPIGDINSDNKPDYAISAYKADTVYVFFGSNTTNIDLSLGLDINRGYIVKGPPTWGFGSFSLTKTGDIDGNGVADFAIGDYAASYVYLVLNINYSIDISSGSMPSNVYKIKGPTGVSFGFTLTSDIDIDDSGKPDLAIGAYTSNSNAGKIYIILNPSSSLDFSNGILPNNVYTIAGNPNSVLGSSIVGLKDINRDGFDEILIGASGTNNNAGAAYLFYGSYSAPSGQPTSEPSRQPSAQPTGQPTGHPTGQPTSAPTDTSSLQCINLDGDRGMLSILKHDDRLNFTCSINANEDYQSINVNENIFSSEEVESLPNGVISKLNTTDTDNFCINPEGLKGDLEVSNITSAGCNIKCSYSDNSYANVYLNATLLGEDMATKLCNEANLG